MAFLTRHLQCRLATAPGVVNLGECLRRQDRPAGLRVALGRRELQRGVGAAPGPAAEGVCKDEIRARKDGRTNLCAATEGSPVQYGPARGVPSVQRLPASACEQLQQARSAADGGPRGGGSQDLRGVRRRCLALSHYLVFRALRRRTECGGRSAARDGVGSRLLSHFLQAVQAALWKDDPVILLHSCHGQARLVHFQLGAASQGAARNGA
mmetsp:Transcript_103128/g.300770  ORF Transcript_103128/g.300770 Transcript_103128/m.300770 type:complete len:210 (-) Transcript_103128:14-643(-)